MVILKLPAKIGISSQVPVLEWFKAKGHSVEKGQALCRLQTDAEIVELESPVSGEILEITAPPGQMVCAAAPLAIIGKAGENPRRARHIIQKTAAKSGPDLQQETAVEKTSQKISKKEDTVETTPQTTQPAGNAIPVLMPQAGQSMEEGTVLSWKVRQGDRIAVGQIIFEIETDKATMEVEAVDAGRLARIVVQEGQIAAVKTPVAYLAESDADIDAFLSSQGIPQAEQAVAAPAAQKTSTPAAAAEKPSGRPVVQTGPAAVSPAARKLAKEKGIDLSAVGAGSGPGGRILSTDLDKVQPAATGPKTYPLSKMRRAIAQNLLYSKQNIPHFYLKCTVEAAALFQTYQKTKTKFKCTVNDFVVMACAKALRQHPGIRCQYRDTEIVELPAVNIGIAVGTDQGLTVPVLINADRLDLQTLAERSRGLVENARGGKLEGVGQGVFTITNLGMFRIEEFSAIINPPESAILAVGAIREDIKVQDGSIRPTRLMTMSLSVDHRVIDGVIGAQFLQSLKEYLENPEQLL